MGAGGRLGRSFYARSAPRVARSLLGRVLVGEMPEGRVSVRIVETEAYEEDDAASHSYRGRTSRTAVMFGPPGYLYVYFTYGMHFCMNVVTGRDEEGSAVLLRSARPLEGEDIMARRRGTSDPRLLCSGPARLCESFGIDRTRDGADLVTGSGLWIEGRGIDRSRVGVGPRIGISAAASRPWRFFVAADPFVSRARVRPVRD